MCPIKIHTFSQKEVFSTSHSIDTVARASERAEPPSAPQAPAATFSCQALKASVSSMHVESYSGNILLDPSYNRAHYSLLFRRRPPRFSGVEQLLTEVCTLLEKETIERDPPSERVDFTAAVLSMEGSSLSERAGFASSTIWMMTSFRPFTGHVSQLHRHARPSNGITGTVLEYADKHFCSESVGDISGSVFQLC